MNNDEGKIAKYWYNKIDNAEGIDEKILVLKEILKSGDHNEIDILDALDSLPQKDEEQTKKYNEFLEFIMDEHKEIFIENISWLSRDLIYWYSYTHHDDKIKQLVDLLIEYPKEDPDVILDIIDILMLYNYSNETLKLIEIYYKIFNEGSKMIASGLYELAIPASCCILDKYVNLENKRYDIDEIKKEMDKFKLEQKDEYLRRKLDVIVGKNKDSYELPEKRQLNHLDKYYFTLTFIRFLIEEKGFKPSTSCFIHQLILDCFYESKSDPINFNIKDIDKYIASWCGIASIRITRSFGIISAFILYIKFLHKNEHIDNNKFKEYIQIFNDFASYLLKDSGKHSWKYSFIFDLSLDIKVNQEIINSPDDDDFDDEDFIKAKKKIGRNEPCPCGSGKKYKKCCLEI